jgi:hypothetical protein
MEGCIEGKGEGSMDGFHEGAEVGLDVVGERVGLLDGSNVDWVDGLIRVAVDISVGDEDLLKDGSTVDIAEIMTDGGELEL